MSLNESDSNQGSFFALKIRTLLYGEIEQYVNGRVAGSATDRGK